MQIFLFGLSPIISPSYFPPGRFRAKKEKNHNLKQYRLMGKYSLCLMISQLRLGALFPRTEAVDVNNECR